MLQMSGFQVCSGKTGILLFSPTENNFNFNFHCQLGWSLGFGCHDNSSHILIFCEKLSRHLWKSFFEGGGDGAVDDEVGGEVEHDEEVGHRLEAHHPEGRDVLVKLLHTSNLLLWVKKDILSSESIPTYESDNKDSKKDPQGVAEDVRQHNRGEGHLNILLGFGIWPSPPLCINTIEERVT